MFETGDFVIYGNAGICEVKGVTTIDRDGFPKDRLYYILQPDNQHDGTIYTPVNSAKPVLRKMMTQEEAKQLLEEIPSIPELEISNDKQREATYKECLRSCDSRETIRILKTIYTRRDRRLQSGKKSTALDERYMKLAETSLCSEISKLLDIPKPQLIKLVQQRD